MWFQSGFYYGATTKHDLQSQSLHVCRRIAAAYVINDYLNVSVEATNYASNWMGHRCVKNHHPALQQQEKPRNRDKHTFSRWVTPYTQPESWYQVVWCSWYQLSGTWGSRKTLLYIYIASAKFTVIVNRDVHCGSSTRRREVVKWKQKIMELLLKVENSDTNVSRYRHFLPSCLLSWIPS
jgi:hypothetical protein